MTFSQTEVLRYIDQYEKGVGELEGALAAAPLEALYHKPAPSEWSNHQIVCHCSDVEIVGAMRMLSLAADPDPLIVAFDPDDWANLFYNPDHSLEVALAAVRGTRTRTAETLRSLPEHIWNKIGRHTVNGEASLAKTLASWSGHLHEHADQIRDNVRHYESASN